jgi:hypothetical protein
MLDTGNDLFNSLLEKWWGQLLVGLSLFSMSVFVYRYLSNLEDSGQNGSIHWLLALTYAVAGKWGSTLILAVPGVVSIGVGIRNLLVALRGDEK